MHDSTRERLREISRGAAPRIEQPADIAVQLAPHQVVAAEYASLAPRMILSDHSGTGKDYCAIAALTEAGHRPLLISAPPLLLPVWREHFERALPDWSIVEFERSGDITRGTLRGPDVVLLRHRQLSSAPEILAEARFRGLILDQCQMLACSWSRLAIAARQVVAALPDESRVVASSSQAWATPRCLASVLEVLGLLDCNPAIAAIRHKRSWNEVSDAAELLDELRGECLLARSTDAVLALLAGDGARPLVV
jgi:hypothetical protein